MIMTKILLPALAGLLLLSGCSHLYVISMSDGSRYVAYSKPKLVNGFYHFKDAKGKEARPIYSGEVREIAPPNMMTDETANFKPVQSK
jgi:hypothetical protein